MELPRIKTRVVHSESNNAWNVVGTNLGDKYKIARVPYFVSGVHDELDERNKREAYEHAEFISTCFNVVYETQQLNDERKFDVGLDDMNTSEHYLSVGIPILDKLMNVGIHPDKITMISGESEIFKTDEYIKEYSENAIKKRSKK